MSDSVKSESTVSNLRVCYIKVWLDNAEALDYDTRVKQKSIISTS